MDMSSANQAFSAEWVVGHGAGLERRVYDVLKDIDDEIARLKLATMGVSIDTPPPSSRSTWTAGTRGRE